MSSDPDETAYREMLKKAQLEETYVGPPLTAEEWKRGVEQLINRLKTRA